MRSYIFTASLMGTVNKLIYGSNSGNYKYLKKRDHTIRSKARHNT